jgi:BirA family biotin operon repressor/biotin-[acetyl-CoA-carboxylase] ligase
LSTPSNETQTKKLVRCHFRHLPSTQTLLTTWASKTSPPPFAAVSTDVQTAGRGQYGSSWADPQGGGNIALSLHTYPKKLRADQQFLLQIWSSLAIADALTATGIPEESVRIKWPNDILVNSEKIAGLLLQSSIAAAHIRHATVGLGLNVGGTPPGLSHITSLSKQGVHTEARFFRESLIRHLYKSFQSMDFERGIIAYRPLYHRRLWKFRQPVLYREGSQWEEGRITGISPIGHLCMDTPGGPRTFTTKSIQFQLSPH